MVGGRNTTACDRDRPLPPRLNYGPRRHEGHGGNIWISVTSCLVAVNAASTKDWRSSWTKRAQLALIAGVGYPLINALGHTLRWRVEGGEHYDAVCASGRQPIMAFWHGRILSGTLYFQRRGIVVITSE